MKTKKDKQDNIGKDSLKKLSLQLKECRL